MNKRQRKKQWKKQFGNMEIGNLLWGHSRGKYLIDREKFQERFCNLLIKNGYDTYGDKDPEFVGEYSDEFIVRPYFWGDEEDNPKLFKAPNFECVELGLEIRWYKYPLRDSYSNIPFTEKIMKKLESI